mmetsp:Transcript_34506/g.106595  ORF Transcript_34506/g.106595 Transcript_34506/m.106595 type:complete len:306 (+) Transcript_34506:1193-2110(+)
MMLSMAATRILRRFFALRARSIFSSVAAIVAWSTRKNSQKLVPSESGMLRSVGSSASRPASTMVASCAMHEMVKHTRSKFWDADAAAASTTMSSNFCSSAPSSACITPTSWSASIVSAASGAFSGRIVTRPPPMCVATYFWCFARRTRALTAIGAPSVTRRSLATLGASSNTNDSAPSDSAKLAPKMRVTASRRSGVRSFLPFFFLLFFDAGREASCASTTLNSQKFVASASGTRPSRLTSLSSASSRKCESFALGHSEKVPSSSPSTSSNAWSSSDVASCSVTCVRSAVSWMALSGAEKGVMLT